MKKLIHICGAARTGTTILGLALGQSDNAFYVGEIHAKFRPYRIHHFDPLCSCGESTCPVWASFNGLRSCNYVNTIAHALDVDFIIDSSGDLPWLLDHYTWSRREKYSLINILTWKAPLNLAYSQWKRNRPIENALRVFETHYARIIRLGTPFVTVEVNELAVDPAGCMQKICSLAGMDFSSDMIGSLSAEHFLFGSAGVREQLKNDGLIFGVAPDDREYDSSFREAYDAAVSRYSVNSSLDDILDVLRMHSIHHTDVIRDGESYVSLKPTWYYMQRVYRGFKRFIPETLG